MRALAAGAKLSATSAEVWQQPFMYRYYCIIFAVILKYNTPTILMDKNDIVLLTNKILTAIMSGKGEYRLSDE